MAMGGRGQREAENAIACCRPFRNSTGSFYGTRGGTRDLGWLRDHPQKLRIKELLEDAVYVVWSYGTPLGCVTEDEDGNITKWYFDESHSATTSHHQTLVRVGFSDFETVGIGPWSRSQGRAVRRTGGIRPRTFVRERPQTPSLDELSRRAEEANEVVRGYAEAARREPTAAHVYGALADQEDRQRSRRVEARVAAMETGLARAEQGYMTPRERDGRPTREQMLDPRYGDPDWTPWSTFHGNLPEGADERDRERVEREGLWTL